MKLALRTLLAPAVLLAVALPCGAQRDASPSRGPGSRAELPSRGPDSRVGTDPRIEPPSRGADPRVEAPSRSTDPRAELPSRREEPRVEPPSRGEGPRTELSSRGAGPSEELPFRIAGRSSQSTIRGEGSLGLPGPNRRLDEATITLDRTGAVKITLRGERMHSFHGQWSGGQNGELRLDIDRAYERFRARAVGYARMTREGELVRLEFSGECDDLGGKFNVEFRGYQADERHARPGHVHEDRGREIEESNRGNWELEATRRGRGSIGLEGPNRRVSQASVDLRRSGSAKLSFYSDDTAYDFTGTWRARGRDSIELFIDQVGRGLADGTGLISLSSTGFSRIELRGQSRATRGDFQVSFDASERDYRQSRYRGANSVYHGRGSLGLRGPNQEVREVAVYLSKNGAARIDFRGERSRVLGGTWFACQDPDGLDLEIDSLGGSSAKGTGHITLRRGEVSSIEIRGRSRETGEFHYNFATEPSRRGTW